MLSYFARKCSHFKHHTSGNIFEFFRVVAAIMNAHCCINISNVCKHTLFDAKKKNNSSEIPSVRRKTLPS